MFRYVVIACTKGCSACNCTDLVDSDRPFATPFERFGSWLSRRSTQQATSGGRGLSHDSRGTEFTESPKTNADGRKTPDHSQDGTIGEGPTGLEAEAAKEEGAPPPDATYSPIIQAAKAPAGSKRATGATGGDPEAGEAESPAPGS